MSIYWRKGRTPLSKQLKLGLGLAFQKFDEYQLAKYNRGDAIKLRDVLFLSHAKPKDRDQAALWKRLVDDELATPDTWETKLSSGADKGATFESMLREGKLGYLALLRNLRNMEQSGVDRALIEQAILARKGAHRVLPFRFVSAARATPSFEPVLDQALIASLADAGEKFDGDTVLLVDVSGSMDWGTTGKSQLTRMDAAATLAAMFPGKARTFTFSNSIVEVPTRKGMAGIDAIIQSQPHGGTQLGSAINHLNQHVKYDRLIVITDEQSSDRVPDPAVDKSYIINVAPYRNGVDFAPWKRIDGFSEKTLDFIAEYEASLQL